MFRVRLSAGLCRSGISVITTRSVAAVVQIIVKRLGVKDILAEHLESGGSLSCLVRLGEFKLRSASRYYRLALDHTTFHDKNIPPSMSSQTLAQKERKLFSELLQAYEQKQLSKGRKIADQILKKYPQHGGKFMPHCFTISFV